MTRLQQQKMCDAHATIQIELLLVCITGNINSQLSIIILLSIINKPSLDFGKFMFARFVYFS